MLNLIGSSNGETNFLHRLLLTDTQVSKFRKAFANGSSANIKFSKTKLSKIAQSGEFITGKTSIFGPSTQSKAPPESFIKSYVTESVNTDCKNDDAFLDAGLSLLNKKIKNKFYQSKVRE